MRFKILIWKGFTVWKLSTEEKIKCEGCLSALKSKKSKWGWPRRKNLNKNKGMAKKGIYRPRSPTQTPVDSVLEAWQSLFSLEVKITFTVSSIQYIGHFPCLKKSVIEISRLMKNRSFSAWICDFLTHALKFPLLR